MSTAPANAKRPPSDDDNLASLVQSGPIGQCLQEALNDLVSESFVEEMEQEVRDSNDETPSPIFDKSMAECVMKSFGRAVAAQPVIGKTLQQHYFMAEWIIITK